jgi:hypothetical protein
VPGAAGFHDSPINSLQSFQAWGSKRLKQCRGACGEWKPFEAFCVDRSKKDGLLWRCKDCEKEYRKLNAAAIKAKDRAWYIANADAVKAQQKAYQKANGVAVRGRRRARNLRKKYGMSVEEYDEMFQAQSGQCANPGCSREPINQPLSVDHDHACCPGESCGNCIRGLLCSGCNSALGYVDDDMERMRGLVKYLEGYAGLGLVTV